MSAMPALLKAEGVIWAPEQEAVLSGVDFEIRQDELVSVIGPNGGGKTSLVRVLLGLEIPTAGRIWRQPGIRIGYVPQQIQMDKALPLTVKRFLDLFGVPTKGANADLVLSHLDISPLLPHFVYALSRGQLQRVLLARALFSDPDLVILDEPTQGLDINAEAEYYKQIEWLRESFRASVCVISHDLHWVMAKTDRVYCLNGHICCSGSPGELEMDPAYQSLFKSYAHHHDHAH